MDRITLKCEHPDVEITYVCNAALTAPEFIEEIQKFMLACGWRQKSIEQAILIAAEDIQIEKEIDATVEDELEEEDWDEFLKQEGHDPKADWGLKPGESCFYTIGRLNEEKE